MNKILKNNAQYIIIFYTLVLLNSNLSAQYVPEVYPTNIQVNYIRTFDASAPEQNASTLVTRSLQDVKQTTQYLDGLGRPLQTVIRKGSLVTNPQNPTSSANATDMVSLTEYDALGREQYKWLPYASTANDGLFKTTPFVQQLAFYNSSNPASPVTAQGETYFYSKANFEPSPLNRVTDTYAPGNNWAGSELNAPAQQRNVQMKYWINTSTDAVRIWNVTNAALGSFGGYSVNTSVNGGIYPAGELFKNVSIDERKNQVLEFKDKEGKVILKKVFIDAQLTSPDDGTGRGHAGWMCTYYIYDDLNNLRCVIQPEAVKKMSDPPTPNWDLTPFLNERCFRYEYDSRNRMIIKKVPGAAPVFMIYDNRDRLILTQTGNMTEYYYSSDVSMPAQWLYTEYDQLNRPRRTSLLALSDGLGFASGATMLTKNFAASTMAADPANINTYFNAYGISEISEYGPVIQTETYYDDYAWATNVPFQIGFGSFVTSEVSYGANEFAQPSNTAYPYAQPISPTTATRGMVTGSLSRYSASAPDYPTYLYTVIHYDDKGRPIQTKSTNHLGGADIITTQYSWIGQVLMTTHKQHLSTNSSTPLVTSTRYIYDDLGRQTEITKRITQGSIITVPAYKTTATMQYNALGQLKTKTLGKKSGTNNSLANLSYDYNIRGWLLGTNRNFLTGSTMPGDQWFGFELGYDKPGNQGGNNFTAQQYNGNISGAVWRSVGDKVNRKFDYSYDAANRLLKGNFVQLNSSGAWNDAEMDFTTRMGNSGADDASAYDYNSNIKLMGHRGWKPGGSVTIDDLKYSFFPNSNKLKAVEDLGVANNKLGDFEDENGTYDPAATDYGYDLNGNLITDYNKGLRNFSVFGAQGLGLDVPFGNGVISYNHLNLPVRIGVTDPQGSRSKGFINYLYDGTGNKLQKVVNDRTSGMVTTTDYIGGSVYESKGPGYPQIYSNKIQFTGHEEGRIRALYNNTASPHTLTGFAFDYMLKDHLGNVRMVLTDEEQTISYPAATLEGTFDASTNSMINHEKQFYNIDNTKVFSETGPGQFIPSWLPESAGNSKLYYNNNSSPSSNTTPIFPPNDKYPVASTPTQTDGSSKLYKLNATTNKTGLEFMIKVMAGDKIDIFGKSYFLNTATLPPTSPAAQTIDLLGLMTTMLLAPANAAASKGISAATLNTINNGIVPNSFFRGNTSETNNTIPKAYINYIFLDEQFKYAGGNASRVGSSGTVKDHWYADAKLQDISVPKNGYIFVYVSNESNLDVLFDNLQVIHKPGPILEETHYYPFGLTMAGISSKAAGVITNRLKYSGKEEQRLEFSDGSGLETYDFGARNYDQQIGRWQAPDPMAHLRDWVSPYNFCQNNPISRVDPDGALDGDYYDRQGNHLGSDNKVDDKAYIADRKNADGTFKNARELSVPNSVLNQFANTIAIESGAESSGSWQESFGIGLAIRNIANAKNKTIGEALRTEGIFGFIDGGNSTEYKKNAEFSMQAALYSVLEGRDFTNGATKWDGIDFLAWGLNSPNGTPHNKFEEYRSIYIEASIYSNYKNSITNTIGSSTKYHGKSYSFPAPVFENMANWKMPSSSVPWVGFMYSTGVRVSNSLDATASFGNTIFWKTIKE